MQEAEIFQGFWDHVTDLRKTVVKCLLIIFAGMAVSLFFYQDLFSLLTSPLKHPPSLIQHQEIKRQRLYNSGSTSTMITLPQNAIEDSVILSSSSHRVASRYYEVPQGGFIDFDSTVPLNELVIFGPIEGMSITLKICLWMGLVASSPFWLYCLMQFISPALRREEKRAVTPFFGLSLLFLTAGFLFAYYLTIPLANHYLLAFNNGIGQNLWGLSAYLDYTLALILANGLAFELCVVLLFLVHFSVLSPEGMAAKRRHVIVGAFIVGALLTPPDVLTQFMMAIPLLLLYEVAIAYGRFRKRITSP